MNLGDKLKLIIQEKEESAARAAKAKEEAQQRASDKEMKKVQRLVNDLAYQITESIEAGQIPSIKVNDYDTIKWIRDVQFERSNKFLTVWVDFLYKMQLNGLKVTVTEDHDGFGERSWLVISAQPA